jgi:hypothetical protein
MPEEVSAAAAASQPDIGDAILVRILGRDLQTATLRGVVYLAVVCAVAATIAALAR